MKNIQKSKKSEQSKIYKYLRYAFFINGLYRLYETIGGVIDEIIS